MNGGLVLYMYFDEPRQQLANSSKFKLLDYFSSSLFILERLLTPGCRHWANNGTRWEMPVTASEERNAWKLKLHFQVKAKYGRICNLRPNV